MPKIKTAKEYCQYCGAYNMNIHNDGICWACHQEIGYEETCMCVGDKTTDCNNCDKNEAPCQK